MGEVKLIYFYDPLCGWCYAAGPLVAAVMTAGIRVELLGGGLFSTPTQIDAGKRHYMRQSDARIASTAGVEFGSAYLDNLLSDPKTVFWSRPVISAILSAGSMKAGGDLAMLRAVQRAHYVEGRHVVASSTLADLAVTIGLPVPSFERTVERVPVDDHITQSRALMRRAGFGGFPGMMLVNDFASVRIEHEPFYGRPTEFVRAVLMQISALPGTGTARHDDRHQRKGGRRDEAV